MTVTIQWWRSPVTAEVGAERATKVSSENQITLPVVALRVEDGVLRLVRRHRVDLPQVARLDRPAGSRAVT
jgi:hypothetical protein